jgi:hypothetical protein
MPSGLDIIVQANGADFLGSEGLCGSWNSGGVKDRSGNPFPSPTDTDDYAQEWQVQLASEVLFSDGGNGTCTNSSACSENFPLPAGEGNMTGTFPCKGNDGTHNGRNLNGNGGCPLTCNDVDAAKFPEHKPNCVFDVIVTGNNDFACTPAYIAPNVIRQEICPQSVDLDSCVTENSKCKKKGGGCVSECATSKDCKCKTGGLCHERECLCKFPKKRKQD